MKSKSLPAMDAETRAAYFASNWGSKMYYKNEFGEFSHDWDSPHFEKNVKNSSSYLLLIPLHLISDEDKTAIENIEWVGEDGWEDYINFGKSWAHTAYINGSFLRDLSLESADYLRSRGYAIPFRQWSVDQLVELGVLRLKEK